MPRSKHIFEDTYENQKSRPTPYRVLTQVALAFGAIFFLFVAGEFVQRTVAYTGARNAMPDAPPYDPKRTVVDIILNTTPEMPLEFMRDGLVGSGLPVYDLRISDSKLKYLHDTAEKVTALGESFDIPRQYVSADFRMGTEWIPIKVKLRGQTASHYHKRAASLRLNFPKKRLLHGKEQVNISFLYDKGLTSDVTANWELQRYGILTWDSNFVVLRINNVVIGLFQEIEQFGRSIWDRNRRSEGYIFAGHGQLFGDIDSGYSKANEAIELLRPCNVPRNQPVPEHCNWEFFSEYFDIGKWSWAAAMTVLLNSTHAWNAENMRIFWDPSRGTFEPIPWDYLYYPLNSEIHTEGEQRLWEFRESLYNVAEFRRLRDQRLWTLITTRLEPMVEHANGLFEMLSEPLSYDLRHFGLQTDQDAHDDYIETLRINGAQLKELFERNDLIVTSWPDGDDSYTVQIQNFGKSFVRIDSFRFSSSAGTHDARPHDPVIVDGFWLEDPGTTIVRISAPDGMRLSDISPINEVTGNRIGAESITFQGGNKPAPVPSVAESHATLEIELDGVRTDGKTITFGPGQVSLPSSLTIPTGYRVVFNPGLNLLIGDDASLVIHGDLEAVGNELQPIEISGLQSRENFGGVFVQGTRSRPSKVHIEYLRVRGGKGGESKRSFFSSPFSVHDGIVQMKYAEFVDASADDGINLKNAEVDISNILVQRSSSDAVDCDFCTGVLVNNRILDSGGDGFDFSGSNVTLKSNVIERCADKGVSFGEATNGTATDNDVKFCYIGLAVKDTSSATIKGGHLQNLQVGIAMYIKKHTFGPGEATIQNIKMTNVESRYLHDGISILRIIDPDDVDLKIAAADRSETISTIRGQPK